MAQIYATSLPCLHPWITRHVFVVFLTLPKLKAIRCPYVQEEAGTILMLLPAIEV